MRVIRYLGYVFLISACFRVFPVGLALFRHEPVLLFIVGALISLVAGGLLVFVAKSSTKPEAPLDLTRGLMLVALSFVFLSMLGAISYLPSFDYNYLDACFESVSGFTTTGMTLFDSLDDLPKSLLLWRAMTQWLGGIGILMVFLFIFSRLKTHSFSSQKEAEEHLTSTSALYQAQGFTDKMSGGMRESTRSILLIYMTYTILGIIALLTVGTSLLDSVGLTFTALSTGSFTMSDSGFSGPQSIILCVIMVLGAVSFVTHSKLFSGRFKEFGLSLEKNVFLIILMASILIVMTVWSGFGTVVFELVSAFTTTGFSSTPLVALPQLFITVIVIGMLIGGCVASTAGGIKVYRIFTLLKSIPWIIKRLSSPRNAVIPFRMGDENIEENSLMILGIYVFTYILIIFSGLIIFMVLGYGFLDSSFQMVSALGTVGLQSMPLISVPWLGKLILMFCMLLGRLEIFPLLVLLRNLFRK